MLYIERENEEKVIFGLFNCPHVMKSNVVLYRNSQKFKYFVHLPSANLNICRCANIIFIQITGYR